MLRQTQQHKHTLTVDTQLESGFKKWISGMNVLTGAVQGAAGHMLGHLISPRSDTTSTETQIKYRTRSPVVDARFHVLKANMLNR